MRGKQNILRFINYPFERWLTKYLLNNKFTFGAINTRNKVISVGGDNGSYTGFRFQCTSFYRK